MKDGFFLVWSSFTTVEWGGRGLFNCLIYIHFIFLFLSLHTFFTDSVSTLHIIQVVYIISKFFCSYFNFIYSNAYTWVPRRPRIIYNGTRINRLLYPFSLFSFVSNSRKSIIILYFVIRFFSYIYIYIYIYIN